METEKLWKNLIGVLIIWGFLIYFLAREPIVLNTGNSVLGAQQCLIGGIIEAGSHVSEAEGGKSPLLISTMLTPLLSLSPNSISYAPSEI